VLERRQLRERIRGGAAFAAAINECPSNVRWAFRVNRIVADASETMSDVSLIDGV
jgi:hypothetical protein